MSNSSLRAAHVVCFAEMKDGTTMSFTVALESTEATMVEVYAELTALLDEEVASVFIDQEATIINPQEIEDLYPVKLLRPYLATSFANANQSNALTHITQKVA